MVLTPKERELAAVGISAVAGCKPCVRHHLRAAREAQATDEEIARAIGDALAVRRSATAVMEKYALGQVGKTQGEKQGTVSEVSDWSRIRSLVSVGAAYTASCTSNLRKHLALAHKAGVSSDEVEVLLKLAVHIKGRGAYHVNKYLPPKTANRIFLFLDLDNSTAIAEQLDHELYSRFIRRCFHDFAELAIRHRAEIYKYVGDGVIVSWDVDVGVEDSNCLSFFFSFTDKLTHDQADYEQRFGVAPVFRGGMDTGRVTIAEVGDIKREIEYHGDVLNTAARLLDLCKTSGEKLLISERVNDVVSGAGGFVINPHGRVILRGKAAETEVYSVEAQLAAGTPGG